MSKTTSSGARKPKGAGLPILSLRMRAPSSSMRAASSTTGPRTSYKTLSSLLDFLNVRMGAPPVVCDAESLRIGRAEGAGFEPGLLARAASGPGPSPAASHVASASSTAASTSITSRRGMVLPLTYWLTWLFPRCLPRVWAMRITSACLAPRSSISCFRRCANVAWVTNPLPPFMFISN